MTIQQLAMAGGASLKISLYSGTEYTSNAVYIADGSSVYWWSVNLAGSVTPQGQGITKAWVIGQKLYATKSNFSGVGRSNFVGEYVNIFSYTGSVQTFSSPQNIIDQGGSVNPVFISVEMWGQGNPGFTQVTGLPLVQTTYTVIIGNSGGGSSGGSVNRNLLLGSPVYVERSGTYYYGHAFAGVFTANPYDANFYPTISNTSTIYGIAGGGGWGSNSNAGGGGLVGQDGEVCTGGSQSSPGNQGYPDSQNNQIEAGSLIYGGGRSMGYGGCAWAIGGGGLYPGGSAHRNGCSPTAAAAGSGFAGTISGTSSQTIQYGSTGWNTSPYYSSGRVVFRIR